MTDANVNARVPPLPDFLGVGGRIQVVSNLLENAQGQLANFQAMRLVNNHDWDDPIPDIADKDAVSYRERCESLQQGISALCAENEDIADELIAEAVKRRRKHNET